MKTLLFALLFLPALVYADFSGRYSGTLKLRRHYVVGVSKPARSTSLTFRVVDYGSFVAAYTKSNSYRLLRRSRSSFGAEGATMLYPDDPKCAGVFDLVFSRITRLNARVYYQEVASCTDGRFLHREYLGNVRRR